MIASTHPERLDGVETRRLPGWGTGELAGFGAAKDGRIGQEHQGELIVADVPALLFTDECPTYIRPAAESATVTSARASDPGRLPDLSEEELGPVLLRLLGSPSATMLRMA